jgi:transcriptional regulator with XRE-family HTH domain
MLSNMQQHHPIATRGSRLRGARLARGLTPAALAALAGVSEQQVIDREQDLAPSSGVSTLPRLARVMGVEPGWLAWGAAGAPAGR